MIQAPVQIETAKETGESADLSLVVQFLAKTDAQCVRCAYNLRGCTQPCCPECGEEIRLCISGSSTRPLHLGLKYVVTGVLVQAAVSCLWMIWYMFNYGLMRIPGGMGAAWYVRFGLQGVMDLAIALVAFILLKRLRALEKGRGTYDAIPRLCLALGLQVAAMIVVVGILSFFN